MTKQSSTNVTLRRDLIQTILFSLGAFEFFAAALFILFIDRDPKNASLLGFSAQRWGLFLVGLVLGCASFALAVRIRRDGTPAWLAAFISALAGNWIVLPVVMCLSGLGILIAPPDLLGNLNGYFERISPILFVICILPLQLCLPRLLVGLKNPDQKTLAASLLFLGFLALLFALIGVTRLGITYEKSFWNVAGLPLTALQFIVILNTSLLALSLSGFFSRRFLLNWVAVDIILALAVYLLAAGAWSFTPMLKHFTSIQPSPPYYQPYPFADAQVHDIGALSIIRGFGIYYGQYIDKPLYLVLLAFLHRLAGFDYVLLTRLHAAVMALMVPVMYWLGKSFHSRFFGLVLALVTVLRQINAITLSNVVSSTNPRLLLTEITTMLGLVLFTWLVFTWFSRRRLQPWLALLSGGLLGAIALVRMNPVALLPAILLACVFVYWDQRKAGLSQALVFVLGFSILLAPWLMTGVDQTGKPWLLVKFQDVINVRYLPGPNLNVPVPTAIPVPARPNLAARTPAPLISTTPAPVLSGKAPTAIDIQEFPGFMINHSLHNLVGAFLALPDSLSRSDQELAVLVTRPYWQEMPPTPWQGEIPAAQVPFLVLNLAVLAMGLGWSWRRWRWAGMIPLIVFLVYCLSLGFARNSGSRYLVPVDWIVYFYYCLGFAALAGLLLPEFILLRPLEAREEGLGNQPAAPRVYEKRMLGASFALVLAAASLIPLVQAPRLLGRQTCQSGLSFPASQLVPVNGMKYRLGEILYPRYYNDANTFIFNSCGWTAQVHINGALLKLPNSQPAAAAGSDQIPHRIGALYLLPGNSAPQQLSISK